VIGILLEDGLQGGEDLVGSGSGSAVGIPELPGVEVHEGLGVEGLGVEVVGGTSARETSMASAYSEARTVMLSSVPV